MSGKMVLNACRIKAIRVLEKAGEHRLTPDNQGIASGVAARF
jgi:hypothetical protein